MKVKCKNCNKRFDFDAYSGVCPKCGKYYRKETQQAQDSAMYGGTEYRGTEYGGTEYRSTEYSNTEDGSTEYERRICEALKIDKKLFDNKKHDKSTYERKKYSKRLYESKGYEKQKSAQSLEKGDGKWRWKVSLAIIICMILVPLGGYAYYKVNYTAGIEAKTMDFLVENTNIHLGDTILYKGNRDYYEVCIKDVQKDEDKRLMPPEGYELWKLSYEIKPHLNNDDDSQHLYDTIAMYPYIITKKGYYLKPTQPFNIGDHLGLEHEDIRKMGMTDSFNYKNGTIYFLVKEGDLKGLLISENDKDKYRTGKLRRKYIIDELEVN